MFDSPARIALAILSAAVLIAFIRLQRGPTLPDRVVAIDLIGVLIVGVIVVGAAVTGERAFLDVAIVLALISFVGTVAYARFVERQEVDRQEGS
jgi:multicomponent Na+:H+ antiporter subunit F